MGMELEIRMGGELVGWMTTYSPMSHYGTPVLRLSDKFDDPLRKADYGPADQIGGRLAERFGNRTAADFLCRFVENCDPADDVANAIKAFLAQWPDGPQIKEAR